VGKSRARKVAVGAVSEVALGELREWEQNPRWISEPRLAALKRAMVEGRAMLQARPLLALPDGRVLAGNMRLRAARELGWETIPVIYVDLSEDEARVWALRDNNQYGEWDERALAEILAGLAERGIDLALAGFADRDLDRILGHLKTPVDPDEAPDLPTGKPRSRPGRVYELGDHQLLCGDATDRKGVARLLGDVRPIVLWTDPPYGVDYVGKTKDRLRIANDDRSAGSERGASDDEAGRPDQRPAFQLEPA